jgi:aryl-alcohol dehydrogenase-like predicted oxidoreductase
MVELIQIGRNGPKVPALGVGCWAWGDRMYWEYGRGYGKEDLRAAFNASIARGLTFFDTAEIYGTGTSERLLGEFIRESDAEVVVASKCFPYPWRLSARALKGALRRSLKRLGLPYLQLYQMHWPFPPVKIERWMHAMADIVEAGLVKHIGVSNYNVHQTELAFRTLEKRGMHLASNQILYSLLDRDPERTGLLKLCAELGVTVIAYSPIAQGLLTGKYTPQNPPSGRRGHRADPQLLTAIVPLLDAMRRIGEAHGGKTMAQVALNWCMAQGTLPIPGAKNAQQATENAGALGWNLIADEIATLEELSARI